MGFPKGVRRCKTKVRGSKFAGGICGRIVTRGKCGDGHRQIRAVKVRP